MLAVLITRPQNSSLSMALELRQLGYESVIEPLLTIVPTSIARQKTQNIQAVMITSAHALEALINNSEVSDLLDLPCFCVGSRTAEKARVFGFCQTFNAASDGAALAQLIGQSLGDKTKAILHIAGRDVDSKAFETLQSLGFSLISWPVYAAETATELTEATITLLRQQKLDAVLVFSPRTAEILKTLLAQYALQTCCQRLIAIGLSETVINVLKPLPWRKLIATSQPTEDAVIDCLKKNLPVS